jgi:hypothetical protein
LGGIKALAAFAKLSSRLIFLFGLLLTNNGFGASVGSPYSLVVDDAHFKVAL